MSKPTYSFHEVIELIRTADSELQLNVLAGVVTDEAERYDIFHLQVITSAIHIGYRMLRLKKSPKQG